jgi:cytochrome c-type biogenesis protein CcmH/NrfG
MKMRSELFLLAAVAVLAAFSSMVPAQSVGSSRGLPGEGSYTVTGKIMMPDGSPPPGGRVDVSCDFTSRSANVDTDGSYRVTGLPAGNCTIVARIPGYDPLTETRKVENDTPHGQAIYVPFFMRANFFSPTNPMFKDVPKQAIEQYKDATEKAGKGETALALKALESIVATHPRFAAAWYQKGVSHMALKDYSKAVESFVKAIEIKPDYLEAKYGFGQAQLELKNYEVSEAVFRDVIKARPDMPEAHLFLGISLFHLKKSDEAEAELKGVMATKSGDKLAQAHLYLGQIYIQKKRNLDAVEQLQKYLDLVPKAANADRIKSAIADLKKQS